jgi:hypothetical protein
VEGSLIDQAIDAAKHSIARSAVLTLKAMSVTSRVGVKCLIAGGGCGIGAVRYIAGDEMRAGLAEAFGVFESKTASGGAGDQDDFAG